MGDRDELLGQIKSDAVVHGRVTLSSGKEADYYVDLRRVTLSATAAPLVGRVMLDLWRANEELLAEAGVDPRGIENPRLCTACHPELLYSYRKGNRGRLVTLAALP